MTTDTDESTAKLDELEQELMSILDQAGSMELQLSEDDSEYDLKFLSEKLAKVSVFQERLSDLQVRLARINIYVKQTAKRAESALRAYTTELKMSKEYEEQPRATKTPWLEQQTSERRAQTDKWMDLAFVVSEVKDAVNERQGTMKRLDSDLRLHSRLFEAKVAAGAAPRPSFPGQNPGIDLD